MRRKGWTAVKKMVCTAAVLGLLLMNAAALPELGALHAKSAALYAANGQELYVSNADEKLQPASVTKIMTMLLAMEALERGEVTLDTMITGSEHACSMGGTQIWLEPGEQLTLDEMLKAIAVGSANDCAVAVAEHLAGTEAAFVERMNRRAEELGMTDTHFVNCTGLDDGPDADTHLTTAYDIALMSCELLKHDEIKEYTTIWMDTVRNGQFGLSNTNKLVRFYDGTTGLKTGYTSAAGYCLSASAERGGMELVAVVLHCKTSVDRFESAKALLNYGFSNYALVTPQPESRIPPVPVVLGRQESVTPVPEHSTPVLLEKALAAQVQTAIAVDETVQAPVAAGQRIGTMTVTAGEQLIAEIPLVAPEDVAALTFPELWAEFLRRICMSA